MLLEKEVSVQTHLTLNLSSLVFGNGSIPISPT